MDAHFRRKASRLLTVLAGWLVLIFSATPAWAQAPATLGGLSFSLDVTGGSYPFASSGYFLFLPVSLGNFQTIDIYGVGEGLGTYSYVRLNATNGMVTISPPGLGNYNVDFTFGSPTSGTYDAGVPAIYGSYQTGDFEMFPARILESIAGKTIICTIQDGTNPFASTGTVKFGAAASGNTYTMVGDGVSGGNSSGTYTYSGVSSSTGAIHTQDSAGSSNVTYLSFSNAAAGGFATKSLSTGGFQTGHFVIISSLFDPVKGTYAGLFLDTNGQAPATSGFFTATLTAKGSISAKLQMAGHSYPLSGSLSLAGACSNSIIRSGQSPLSVQLQADMAGGDAMTGWVSSGDWTAELTAHRAVYSRAVPAPQSGNKYTLVIPPGDPSTQPGGYGFGALNIDTSGNINFKGTLGDGTKVAQRTFVSSGGQWPLYLSLYSGGGGMCGWLMVSNTVDSDLQGNVTWRKPAQPGAKMYPNGFAFTNGLEVIGSAFEFTNRVPLLDATSGGGVLVLQGGNLAQSITNGFTFSAANTLTTTNKSSLRITTSSGLFQGGIINPATGRAVSVGGALLQKQNAGFGTFAGTNETGSVAFWPLQ